MLVTAVGCSGSFPGPHSPASCYLVQAEHEGRVWSVALDLGNGSLGVLQRYIEPLRLDAVLLTHLHPDHCLDVCPLYVMLSHHPSFCRTERMPVFGPEGVAERLAAAYRVDKPEDLSDRIDFRELVDTEPVEVGPFTITPVLMNHPVVTYGLRIETAEGVVAYTGDTDSTPRLTELMTGADLVLADSAFIEGRDDVPDIHMSGRRAAQAALDAGGVKRLVLTHIPAWNDRELCLAQAREVLPSAELCEPGDVFEVGAAQPSAPR